MPFLELAHIYAHHRRFFPKKCLGEGARELGLADSCGTEKEEASNRTIWIRETGAGPPDGLSDRGDCLLLAHDPLVELFLEAQEALAFFLGELGDGDPGRSADHLGYVLGRHLGYGSASLSGLLKISPKGLQAIPELWSPLEVLGGDGLIFLALQTPNLVFERPGILGLGLRAQADPGGGLVHEVYGLVGQESVT